jgi:biopolymer transport protein ExbD
VGEALVMTAAGLAVALPAVLAYNLLGRSASQLEAVLEGLPMICMPSSEWMLHKGWRHGIRSHEPPSGAETPINTINVTPLVDVMLVLVVIFILAAPMLAATLRVQLPKAQAVLQQAAVSKSDALMVEVSPAGEIWIQGAVTDDAAVQQQLEELGRRNPQAGAAARRHQRSLRSRGTGHGLGPRSRPDAHRLCGRA